MPTFTEQYWKDISTGFEKQANFPHYIGVVDGKLDDLEIKKTVCVVVVAGRDRRSTHADNANKI